MKKVAMKGRYPLSEEDYRKETLRLHFDLRTDMLTTEYKELLHRFFDWKDESRPHPDEVLITNYTFECAMEYYSLVNQLEFLIRLYDEGIMYRVKTEELKHKRCLVQELLCKLEAMEQKLKEKL